MSIVTNFQLLRRVPLFAQVSDSGLDLISQSCTKRRFKRGEVMIAEGTISQALFVLITGRAMVTKSDRDADSEEDKQVILANLGAGDYVGEMSLIDGEPHSATVTADEQLDVFVLQQQDLHRCMHQEPSLALALMRDVVARLRVANQKIELLALKDVSYRVSAALWSLAKTNAQGEGVIADKVPKQIIGKMVGASREMVTRVMKSLESEGVIRTSAGGELILSAQSTA